MPPTDQNRSTDLVLNQSQYALVQDTSKGQIYVHVGHYKTSLESTDQPVRFRNNRFESCELTEAIQPFVFVPDGSYVVLANPAKDGSNPQREKSPAAELLYGRTVNIPGPVRFPLWPGQSEKVIPGHILRSNQYLVARVTNGDEATANRTKAVLKPQSTPTVPSNPPEGGDGAEQQAHPPAEGEAQTAPQPAAEARLTEGKPLVTGQRIVIRGTEYSFFIPPTGIEVEADEDGNYVREAVTLESLQYCVLLSENGKKRFVPGPEVVFPEPNETFVTNDSGTDDTSGRGDSRIFKAIELNPQMGVHVKVIADYKDETGEHKAGEEIFLTGDRQQIYFPRAEHAIIPYRGTEKIHYAVTVPEGEARYVLQKNSGKVVTDKGPQMLLLNPIDKVIVRRVLTEREVRLWYPGNTEVEQFNANLREAERLSRAAGASFLDDRTAERMLGNTRGALSDDNRYGGDKVERRANFTPPKSITLKSKLDGAVSIGVWPGYAVQVVSKSGKRRVVEGPDNVILEYDETLAVFELSKGTPKSAEQKHADVYLRVMGNKVSDIVQAETSDLVTVSIKLSYRVNFEGDKANWFALDDYVGFLTDHLRSVIRGALKRKGIEEFTQNQVDVLRDAVLGVQVDGKPRPGKTFQENGMHVYDLEVLDVQIGDATVKNLLVTAQKEVVQQTLTLKAEQRKLELTKQTETVKRETAAETTATSLAILENEALVNAKQQQVEEKKLQGEEAIQDLQTAIKKAELELDKLEADQRLAIEKSEQDLVIQRLDAETEATVERFKAIAPELVAALQAFSDADLMVKFAQTLKTIPMGLDEGLGEVLERVFKGSMLEAAVRNLNQRHPVGSTRVPITGEV